MNRITLFLLTIVTISLIFTGCGGGGKAVTPPPSNVTVRSIALAPSSPSVVAGRTQQITATASYSDGSTKDVTSTAAWSSSSGSVATINATGLLTAMSQGSATISATFSGVAGSTSVTVSAPVLTALVVAPAGLTGIPAGSTQQFTATGTFSDGSTHDVTTTVTWSSSQSSVASVSASGTLTAAAQGTATITATSGTISASANVTVSAAILTGIALSPSSPSVPLGATQQFTATGTFSDGTTRDVTTTVNWSSSQASVATVTASGMLTAIAQGTATITATSGVVSTNVSVTVNAATLTAIALSPSSPSVPLGATQQFTATGTFSDATTHDVTATVTWSSSASAVATVSTSGMVTAAAQGTATIMASSGNVSGTASVTVDAATLTAIAISPASPSVPLGATQQFTATGTWSDGSTQDLTSTVTWNSSDTAVAAISNGGLLTAVKQGSAVLTAQSGSVGGNVTITVSAAALVSISVVPGSASVAMGETSQFAANGVFSDGSMQDLSALVTWNSSDNTVATVSNSGLAKGVATGSATISALYNSISGSASFAVTQEQLTSASISPDLPSVPAGGLQQFVLTGTFSNGATQDLTGVTWTSSDPTIATIDQNGLAHGLAAGQVTITGAVGDINDATTLYVTAATLESITITPNNTTIAKGTNQQFTVTGTFSDGSTQDLTAAVSWTSSVPGVASINDAGLATGVDAGSATITATSGTLSSTASLNVTGAVLASISVTPAMPSIGIGGTVPFTATGTYNDGTAEDLTTTVTWTSSSATIATISNTGLATAISAGPTNITATYGNVSGSTTFTVTAATLQAVTIVPANPTIAQRAKLQFTAMGTFSDGTQHKMSGVSWASSLPRVASVNGSGLARSKKAGQATIRATVSGVRGQTTLTVTSAALTSIVINPVSPVIAAGTTQQFTVTGNFNDGTTADLTASVRWQTSNYLVATISASGLATGAGPGTATISATFSGLTATATLTVTSATLQSIVITPATPTISLGGTQQFVATGTFSDGSNQVVTNLVQWTSSNASVAVIDKTGLATSAGRGTSTIGAALKGTTNSTTLQVN